MSIRKSDRIISVEHVSKYFGEKAVLNDVNLQVRKGEFVTILGPSGCGKTTLLRLIAGFQTASEGVITMSGKEITQTPPHKRPVNTVFQKYALFPHLNVYNNIAFGLKLKKLPSATIEKKVKQALKMVGLTDYEDRDVDSLSGGQQQRVAIARAIVNEPEVLLLDEPLAALDLKMRKDMQMELKEMHKSLGITFVYVTHDQTEALTMSTKIAIFREGIIIQVAHPLELYNNPANLYVADFIGNPRINFVDGKAEVSASGLTVNSVLGRMTFPADHLKDENMPQEASFDAVLGIRPEQIAINTSRQSPSDIEAHIYTSMPAGSETLVTVKVGGVSSVIKALGITHYNPDQVVYLSIDTTKINVFDKKTENLIKYSVE